MKLKIMLLLVLFSSQILKADNVVKPELTTNEIENLFSLCKIWGFLKYYHPNAAKGTYNWDEQLILMVPEVLKAENKDELSKIYLKWIDNLGTVKLCKSCLKNVDKDYFDKNFDLSWLQDKNLFNEELSKKLNYIQNNRFQGENHYIKAKKSGNIMIQNELKPDNFEYPDQNYRLLSLFRYWNVVEYFYPYKYQTEQNWNEVLKEMIPKFFSSNDKTQYHLAMLETVIKVSDSHAVLYTDPLSDFFGRKYSPAYFNVVENKLVVTGFFNDSLAELNDLKIGDVIEKADGIEVSSLMSQYSKYIRGSNSSKKASLIGFFVTTGKTDSIQLTVKRADREIVKNFGRYDTQLIRNQMPKNGEKYKILNNSTGYVNMSFLEVKDVDKMMYDLKDTKAIIVDYRESMNFTPFLMARQFVKNEKEFAKFLIPDMSYPGRFVWKKSETISPIKNKYYKGRVIVLVDEDTQSASEFASMMFQAGDKATTIGSQTSGADGNVSHNEFLGYQSLITGIGVFYPDKTETQRVGIKIDLVIRPTIKGMVEGRDEILEKAVEFVAVNP